MSYLVVSAIDFGTTYSGYAYSFKHEPDRILTNSMWENEGDGTFKTPTSILFNQHKEFHSFGYEAEWKYARLAENSEEGEEDEDEEDNESPRESHRDWFFFRRFKMTLFRAMSSFGARKGKRITKEMMLASEDGKQLPALTVFSEAIRYLKSHLDDVLEGYLSKKSSTGDVKWVLTVPAIWSNEAKQFMRLAAQEAGIHGEQLVLALEPEAAAVYCKQMSVQKDTKCDGLNIFQAGKKFMVVDCGGGTVDVTAHEVMSDWSLRELHCATGDAIGGTNVDRKFFDFMNDLFEKDTIEKFKKQEPSDWLKFESSFEIKKRHISRDLENNSDLITFSQLQRLFEYFKSLHGEEIKTRLKDRNLQKKIKVFKERLRFDPFYLKEIAFDDPVQAIVRHLSELFSNPSVSKVDTILLVGGFSECSILQNKIREQFTNKKVIHPPEANLAVLKGAVKFGHNSHNISTRLSPKHYGIATNEAFKVGYHCEAYKQLVDGEYVCTDVFKCMIEKNSVLKTYEHIFSPHSEVSMSANIELYESEKINPPKYCTADEGCRMIGQVTVPLNADLNTGTNQKRQVNVRLHFAGTELTVTAVDMITKRETVAKFDCLTRQ